MLIIDSRGQLVMQLFMQATTRLVNGLRLVHNRYLFFD